jgi:hypothetical protein
MAKQWGSVERKQEKLELLSEEISKTGEVSWKRVLEVTDYDELVYKLTLKYLQQKWCDIGNNTIPRVKRLTFACKTILLFFTTLKLQKLQRRPGVLSEVVILRIITIGSIRGSSTERSAYPLKHLMIALRLSTTNS